MAEVIFQIKEKNFWVYVIMFAFYSVMGAVLEHLVYFITGAKKRLANPILEGFPLYGIGAYICILIERQFLENGYNPNSVELFIIFAVVLTLLEYIVGRIIGAGKYNKHANDGCGTFAWDYRGRPYNFEGVIDLTHTILFGFLGLIVIKIHPKIVERVNRMF
jgi:uncharacterized membrane protein